MARKFKTRLFGGDIPTLIKKRIEARQNLAKGNQNPTDTIDSRFKDDRASKYSYGELHTHNFDGDADLSSRTAVVRMWTAVSIAEDIKIDPQPTEFPDNIDEYLINNKKTRADKRYLEKNYFIHNKELHKWDFLPGSRKIYEIGNHVFNQNAQQPHESILTSNLTDSNDKNKTLVESNILKAVAPNEFETDLNEFFKPPAGITGMSYETEGPMGVIRNTTVEFQVHNFSDLERIYMRYFLRPGAQIFIDFGWDTAPLYDPEKFLDGNQDLEDALYGDKGIVTLSNGDIDVAFGHVMDYTATARDDGGFDCSVQIVSKNGAIIANSIDESFKKRVEHGLQSELLGIALSGAFEDSDNPALYWYEQAKKWNQVEEKDRKEMDKVFRYAAGKALGGQYSLIPGQTYNDGGVQDKEAKAALKYGVYFGGGRDKSGLSLYVNLGFLEDKILNKELGFAETLQDLVSNDSKDTKLADDEGTLKAKFNSRNSYIVYNQYLRKAMKQRGGFTGAHFLYPADWGQQYPTYNTLRKMVPDDRIDLLGDDGIYGDSQSVTEESWNSFIESTSTSDSIKNEKVCDIDRKQRKIPMREIFFSVKTFQDIVKSAQSVPDVVNGICQKIRDASGEICDVQLGCNNYGGHTISFSDRNVLSGASADSIGAGAESRRDYLDKLLVFKPFSANSIVKTYGLEFAMPQGGLGNMLAIQASSGGIDRGSNLSNLLNSIIAQEEIERFRAQKSAKNLYVKWVPQIGDYAGQRLVENIDLGDTNTFNFDEFDVSFAHATTGAVNNTGNYTFANPDDSFASQELFGEDPSGLMTSLSNAIDETKDLKGKEVEEEDEEELDIDVGGDSDDNPRRNKVSSVYENYLAYARKEHASTLLPLIEAKVNLSIYGTAGFMPGDLIRVDYIPEQYFENALFQIMKVKHEIGESGWTTSFETQMRLLPTLDPMPMEEDLEIVIDKNDILDVSGADVEVEKKAASQYFKCFDDCIVLDMEKHFPDGWDRDVKAVYTTTMKKPGSRPKKCYYKRVEIDKKSDYKYIKGLVKKDWYTRDPRTDSHMWTFNKGGKGGPGYGFKGGSGNQKGGWGVNITDYGWETSLNDYVYWFYFDPSQWNKGTEFYIVVSSGGNWEIWPPKVYYAGNWVSSLEYMKVGARDLFKMGDLFRVGQETYFSQKTGKQISKNS